MANKRPWGLISEISHCAQIYNIPANLNILSLPPRVFIQVVYLKLSGGYFSFLFANSFFSVFIINRYNNKYIIVLFGMHKQPKLLFLLKYSLFTTLCQFQVYKKVIQLYIFFLIIFFLIRLFFMISCSKILSIVPCPIQ